MKWADFLYTDRNLGKLKVMGIKSWVWSGMHKFPWYNDSLISLEGVEWFCWFYTWSYLHLEAFHWSYKNMLFQAGIVMHRLSANYIVRCFKLKNLESYTRYQVDFLPPLKLFGLWSQNTVGQLDLRIFYFWHVWLVNLNTMGSLLHCTCHTYHKVQ